MPTKRLRRLQERRPEFNAMRRTQLLQAFDFLGCGYGEGVNFDEDAARADWLEHRDALVGYWIQTRPEWLEVGRFGFANPPPGGPGTRPWGWWYFDAPPELRERLAHEGPALIYQSIFSVLARHRMLRPGEEEA